MSADGRSSGNREGPDGLGERCAALGRQRAQLRRMRVASLIEGTTLLALIFIAVPLKHLGGYPIATSIVGPVHGLAFILYVWMLIQTVASGNWAKPEIIRIVVAAFIPFGAFVNERALKRREDALASRAGMTE